MKTVFGEAGNQCQEASGPMAGDVAKLTSAAQIMLLGHVGLYVVKCGAGARAIMIDLRRH